MSSDLTKKPTVTESTLLCCLCDSIPRTRWHSHWGKSARLPAEPQRTWHCMKKGNQAANSYTGLNDRQQKVSVRKKNTYKRKGKLHLLLTSAYTHKELLCSVLLLFIANGLTPQISVKHHDTFVPLTAQVSKCWARYLVKSLRKYG